MIGFFNNYFKKFSFSKDRECLQNRPKKEPGRKRKVFPVLFCGDREKGIEDTDFGSPEERPARQDTESRFQSMGLHLCAGSGVWSRLAG